MHRHGDEPRPPERGRSRGRPTETLQKCTSPSTVYTYTFCLLNICTPPIIYTSIHLLHIYTPSIIYTCIHLLSSPHLYTFYHLHIHTPIIYTPIISKSIHLLSSIHLQSSSHLYTFYHLHIYSHSINYTSIHLLSSAYLCTFYHLYIYVNISTSLHPTCRWPCTVWGPEVCSGVTVCVSVSRSLCFLPGSCMICSSTSSSSSSFSTSSSESSSTPLLT